MGLNLGTLVTILVVLILFIVLDGVRRVLKERRGSLSLKIDKRFENLADAPIENPELPGGGARRGRSRSASDHNATATAEMVPPLVMEPTARTSAPRPLVQVDLFEETEKPAPKISLEQPAMQEPAAQEPVSQKPAVQAPASSPEPVGAPPARPVKVAPAQETPAPRRAAEPQLLDVIVAYLLVPADRPMAGRDLLQALLEQGLRYGDMNIFHRYQGAGKNSDLLFSVANALEPGTFDLDDMENQQFRAITFFMKFPGPNRPIEAFEIMQRTLLQLAEQFEAELRDEHRNPLTQQALTHLREQVQELERRSRLAEARQE